MIDDLLSNSLNKTLAMFSNFFVSQYKRDRRIILWAAWIVEKKESFAKITYYILNEYF